MRRYSKLAVLAALVLTIWAVHPATSEAQGWRFGGRTRVFVGVGFGRPFFYHPFLSPFWGFGWSPYWAYGPHWGYGPGWAYGPQSRDDYGYRDSSLRLDVKPRDTQVYVDGYYSGTVDDFNGIFQRLHLPPGEHELVLYLKGYRTIRQTVNLRAGSDFKVKQQMAKLRPGEANEPPPTPPPDAREEAPGGRGQEVPPEPYQPPRPRRMPPERPAPPEPPEAPAPPGRSADTRDFGALAIRVQPVGSEVLIDGERWQSPETERLVVSLAAGPHRVEVRKDGYVTFSTEVRVRGGETTPLNVSLPERR